MSFIAANVSCALMMGRSIGIHHIMNNGAKFVFPQGDLPYCNSGVNIRYGKTTTNLQYTSTKADFLEFYDMFWGAPSWIDLLNSDIKVYPMWDDHELAGDNWFHDLASANTGPGGGINAPDQEGVNNHFNMGRQAFDEFMAANTDLIQATTSYPGAADEYPSQVENPIDYTSYPANKPPVTDYPPRYYRIEADVNGNVVSSNPHVEMFVMDSIGHRSPGTDADTPAKTLLGQTQKTLFLDRILASTARLKIIMSTKKTYNSPTADNDDTFALYPDERNEILQFIEDNNITGVLWMSGDRHQPHVIDTQKSRGQQFDHVCICSCPMKTVNTAKYGTYDEITWEGFGQCFGQFIVETNRVIWEIRNSRTNKIMKTGFVNAGENFTRYFD